MANYKNHPTQAYADFREMLHASAEKYGNKVFIRQKENNVWRAYTFGRFAKDVMALAAELTARGLIEKKIVLLGENCYRWAVVYMAVVCAGGIIVPLDKNSKTEELSKIIDFCEADALFCSDEKAEMLNSLAKNVTCYPFSRIPTLIKSGQARQTAEDAPHQNTAFNPHAMSILLFSPGQAGTPRGVMLSQHNICFNLREMCQMIYIGENDTFLSVLPLHHAYACTCGLLCALYRGSCIAFCDDVRQMWRDIRRVGATVLLCVPIMTETLLRRLQKLVEQSGTQTSTRTIMKGASLLPTQRARMIARQKMFATLRQALVGELRLVISGGSAAEPEVLKGLREFGIDAYQGYGLSECSPLIALHREHYYNDASVGMATPNTLLDVCDVQEDGIGEIRCRGENVMIGYYKMPQLTQEVIKGGWFYTGDLGYLDDHGYLYVMGRRKNVIANSQGNNIFPEELENLLCRTPFVREAVVVGYFNDVRQDFDIVALLYPDREALREQLGDSYDERRLHVQMQKALTTVNGTVPPYKYIHHYLLRDEEFPKTPSRKIRRAGLAEAAKEEYLKLLK